jgi:hypothetical protein
MRLHALRSASRAIHRLARFAAGATASGVTASGVTSCVAAPGAAIARVSAAALACAALGLAPGGSARAQGTETVDLDGAKVNLTIPAGYCKMDRATPFGQAYYGMQERMQAGVNRVLLLFVDCAELKKSIANPKEPFYHHGSFLSPLQGGRVTKIPAGYTRKQAVEEIAKSIPKLDEKQFEGSSNARTKAEGVTLSKVSSGLLTTDDNAAYMAIAANAGAAGGKESERFRGVVFMTVLKSFAVSGNLYSPVEPGPPFDKLLAQQKANAAAVVKAN